MQKLIYISALLCLFALVACIPEDDDGMPATQPDLPTLQIADATTVTEGSGGTTELAINLRLEGLNLTNVTLQYRTESGSAEGGQDYIEVTEGRLQFTPAEREKTITLTLLADSFDEEDEDFSLVIFAVKNATLANERTRITILDDDSNTNPYNIPTEGFTTPDNYPGMQLTWEDDFSGSQLDPNNWTQELGTGNNGWGNNELQYYRKENTILYEGNLIIEARQESFAGSDFTSSRIVTLNKQTFKYGRIDIRAALPEGQGIWPALWMMGNNIQQIGWPACGEIDIMEMRGQQPGRILGTAHYGASSSQHQFQGSSVALGGGDRFSEEFHVFSIVWVEGQVQWLMDDEPFYTITPADLNGQPWPFNTPFFFIFNLAVGGDFPGNPDQTTIFPQRMIVDYIRVFQ